MQAHILIVEDEPAIRDMIAYALRTQSYQPVCAQDGKEALQAVAERIPDLILLDWMLPGTTGIELVRRFRKEANTRNVPIIMLTAKGEESDRIAGFDSGADDYVVKPFSARELLARIKAVLRRSRETEDDGSIEIGALRLDGRQQKLLVHGQSVHVGPTEYRLLHFFMSHAGRVYTRNQLLDFVWGGGSEIEDRTVDVHVRRLRKVLEPFRLESMIETVRGSGYRFADTGLKA
ncbi:DNA-binding response regulator [Arenimonas maotaiensis]|uniref:Phosphate regulon transcriptional regulatory protein PhoB n=1 Tax=Arenimonas maotaiensis TaxID=1446479 RepID=A0A917CC40_9GAMM|nr:phosphate regulon transcriptional regulator PhoB [Arenimonas maotaiensis]GGF83590.1 DNA-binding response regulator [Arenimonas maotaiensis]